jgi:hypothetical protein
MIAVMLRKHKDYLRPRNWSNAEIKKVASLYDGDVINVSGWKDEDKTGGHYKNYFTNASSYTIANYSGAKGFQDSAGEIFLDLTEDVPEELIRKFQVAINHTTLEHIYEIRRAFSNICLLSSDTVILVTPFLQGVHYLEGSFGDYWRLTPGCINEMFRENGFEVIYQSSNDNEWYNIYVFTVATRNPEKYGKRLVKQMVTDNIGVRLFGLD